MLRRVLVPLSVLLLLASAPVASGSISGPTVRDLGPLIGFRRHQSSYSIAVGDANGDGWNDVLIDHHGSRPAELFQNQPDGNGRTIGMEVAFHLVDTVHGRSDRHGCIMGDPNLDGLTDFLCLKGANQGTTDKWNELWIQGPAGTWTDQAHAWGIEDIWGRGRFPAWIDLNHDKYPDIFLGNDTPRHDAHSTADRLYVNDGGTRFSEVDMGITKELGADCAQVLDVNGDGWDDILLCGKERMYLFVRQGDRFVDETVRYGIPIEPRANGAWMGDLSGDGVLDLVIVHPKELDVQPGGPGGVLGAPVLTMPLGHGHGLAVGDVDGMAGPDIYAVDGCVQDVNQPDVLLLNGGDGRSWSDPWPLPALPDSELAGCGDQAAMVDFDGDGKQDIVVLNGGGDAQPLDIDGPDQLLTLGDWRLPG